MADVNSSENCNSCRFFFLSDRNLGLCKRNPDSINKHNADWCGEFSPNKSSQAVELVVEFLAKEPEPVSVPVKKAGRPKKVKK